LLFRLEADARRFPATTSVPPPQGDIGRKLARFFYFDFRIPADPRPVRSRPPGRVLQNANVPGPGCTYPDGRV